MAKPSTKKSTTRAKRAMTRGDSLPDWLSIARRKGLRFNLQILEGEDVVHETVLGDTIIRGMAQGSPQALRSFGPVVREKYGQPAAA